MKKVVFVLLCSLLGLGATWAVEPDYVVSDGELYIVETLRVSPLFGFSGKNDEGRIRLRASEVDSYRKNGEVFVKVPEYLENQATGRKVFMQALVTKSGYMICRRTTLSEIRTPVDNYYVYRGDDFVLQLDVLNSKHLGQFFDN